MILLTTSRMIYNFSMSMIACHIVTRSTASVDPTWTYTLPGQDCTRQDDEQSVGRAEEQPGEVLHRPGGPPDESDGATRRHAFRRSGEVVETLRCAHVTRSPLHHRRSTRQDACITTMQMMYLVGRENYPDVFLDSCYLCHDRYSCENPHDIYVHL